jgi:DNA-binding Xre family transcriptional regulator
MNRTTLSRRGPFGYNTIMNIFRGSVQWIRISTMERLCHILKLTPGDIYEFEEDDK